MSVDLACLQAIRAGWEYMVHTLLRAYAGPCAPLCQSDAWQDAMRAIDAAALAGNARATQDQCRVLWGLVRTFIDQESL